MRTFNTAGPVRAERHYHIAPLSRIDLDEVLGLIRDERYFVLHAPRQTGKTSALLTLRDLLNSGEAGDWRCVYANFEVGQAGREDTARSMRAMLGELARRARRTLDDETPNLVRHAALEQEGADGALIEVLVRWAEADATPLVLLQAHLQRVVNGGGRIEREYALGRGRTDLLIVWRRGGRERRWVVECKVRHGDLERTIAKGIEQTRTYMDRCAAEAGHLVVFDRSPERSWEQKIFRRTASPGAGPPVTVWGM